MNETSFSQWLCQNLIKQGFFPQRLEVTTGAGIPDIALLGSNTTSWLELKWKTTHIRPEQYIWGKKAQSVGVNVQYVIGSEKTVSIFSLENAEKMSRSWKLVTEITNLPRTKDSIKDIFLLCTQ